MDLITIILTFVPVITTIGFLGLMWFIDAYPFHRAGRADPNARPPIPERHDHKKLSIDWRLSLLRNAGLCVLMVDDDNPTEVMDKIPENFPYIIIYPSQSDSEKDAIVSYGEAMWKGWVDYYGTRKIPKWDDIKPFEPRWESERIAIANRALLNDPDACNGECSNVTMHGYCVNKDYSGNCSYKHSNNTESKNSGAMEILDTIRVHEDNEPREITHRPPSYTGRSLGGGHRSLIDKWGPVLE